VHDGFTVPYLVLIDSGADINVFSYQIGELLGLDLLSGQKAEALGVTGEPTDLYIHPLTLILGGEHYPIKAAFTKALDDKPHGLVGQDGFFSLFKVAFDLPSEEIELTPHRV